MEEGLEMKSRSEIKRMLTIDEASVIREIEQLRLRLSLAEKIIDMLRDYSVGMSFMSEEKVAPLIEEFNKAKKP